MLLPKSGSPRLTTKRGQKGTGDQPTMCPHGTSFTLKAVPTEGWVSTQIPRVHLCAGLSATCWGDEAQGAERPQARGLTGLNTQQDFQRKGTFKAKSSS